MSSSAGIVLAGGRSSRMGTPKAALEWHGSTLLRRTVGIMSRVADGPVVVVRAPGQALPALPPQVDVVPIARGYPQPLAAAYRTKLAAVAGRLVQEGRLRPAFLFDECAVSRLDEAALRADPVLAALDPDLDSVVNINEPADYHAARARPAPEVTIQRFGALAGGHRGPQPVRAATVAAAAAAAGIVLDGHVVAALNGDQITRDGETPLATGDTVFFLAADAGG